MKKTLLSVKELAVELGISEDSVRRAYRNGSIPGERICRMLRFDLERVRQAMRGNGRHDLSAALHTGAVRIGASRPRGAGAPPVSKTGALRAGPLSKKQKQVWTRRRSS